MTSERGSAGNKRSGRYSEAFGSIQEVYDLIEPTNQDKLKMKEIKVILLMK